MKRFFTLLLMMAALQGLAQSYNNEWINFNQTYYKFKVANEGLMQIPKATLDAAGLGSTPVQNFELWRNGVKVPFYSPTSSGTLPANGYLEFYAFPNDGKPDFPMYYDPAYQHNDHYNLITDTAVYFLSVNSDQSGFRYQDVVNNVSGPLPPLEPYFQYTYGSYYKNKQNQGFAADLKEYLYSSSYDKGEYWSSPDIRPATDLVTPVSGLKVYPGGPDATIRFGVSGNALNPRNVRLTVNGSVVKDVVMDYFNDLHTSATLSNSSIQAASFDVRFANASAVATDRMVVSYFEITYPREFKFGNAKNFRFKLPAKAAGYYLSIKEFDYGSTPPVLYDMANKDRFVADITTSPGNILFALPGTASARDLVLVNAEGGNLRYPTGLTAKTFTDYLKDPNKGDFLIITHPSLFVGSAGNNPVNDYKAYRESTEGGKYKVLIADIDELVDQFAFGIKKHPLSVRNFIRYQRDKFARPLKYAFLIGRGMTYVDYQRNQTDPVSDKLNIVPTFGYPASDNLLSAATPASTVPVTPIGRLSVVHGKEIEDYLVKVKEYENTQQNAPNTIAGRAWMKNVVQVTGTNEAYLGTVLCNYMNIYKQIAEDTSYGGKVYTFCKSLSNTTDQFASDQIAKLFNEGIGFLNYFGHSSATTLEFNLDKPESYNNQGKYPVFFVNGCNAGNFFTYYPQRLTSNETLSEKFVLAKQRGSIAFVASTHFGIVNYLNLFLTKLYQNISGQDFNKSLGETTRDAFQKMRDASPTDYFSRLHAEQITINGDPSLRISAQGKPDYVVEESLIKVNPAFISIAETHFQVKAGFMNLGSSTHDSIVVQVKQQYPNGTSAVVYREKIKGIRYSDSVTINIPIVATRDKGKHTLIVSVDDESAVDEIAESNNTATKEINIFEDEARPAFPYNLSIIKEPTQKLYATTANPFSVMKDYVLEIDTTEDFNSIEKKSKVISSPGGVIEYDPQLTYKDSTVYYWRISPVPSNGGNYQWFNQSFTYLKNVEGYNQSHYFQHEKSSSERMYLDNDSHQWKYGLRKNKVHVKNCIFAGSCNTENELIMSVNEVDLIASACVGNSLIFHIFDSVTFKPWKNVDANGNNLYRFGSGSANCAKNRWYNFEFPYMTAASRKLMMDFMDSIPNGSFVVVKSMFHNNPNSYAQTWKNDTLLYGSNKSLYHKLLEAGFIGVDSVYKSVPWAFVYKKGDASYVPKWDVGKDFESRVSLGADFYTPDTVGYISSPTFGPAANWQKVEWKGKSLEQPSTDNPTVDVIGISKTFVETKLFTLGSNDQQFDISSVNARDYPYMRLRMRNADSIRLTPFQLDYWRVFYKPLPEGAMAANMFLQVKDSMEIGDQFKFGIAFKNFSRYDFDSVNIKVIITDNQNVPHTIHYAKQKKLLSGDTLQIILDIPTKDYIGNNTLYVEVNPDTDQLEQYHFNNFLYRNFYVKPDNTNPFLDVTFDGVHILNRDIVSAKPHIQIRLKDEAKHLLLNDTSLLSLEVKYPNGTPRTYTIDNDTLKFTPATSGNDNSAVLDFTPAFTNQSNPDGDEYELVVKGKDKSGNKAGSEYRVMFKVINKPMISNLLNYPNPFSTSTAFVFTITGSELPQNLKIQILTVTGKIVREITIGELGPLRIGRNITDFKWDGTDQFGQKLANGVYLYRVVTSLNGKSLEKYKTTSDNTDKFFTNGYGKMYLMR
ncbi:C25 family cysteine peptidase [Paraflavitalea sp. CAU 1676]|uniref:putative type IX secretion system sortase PorU2 n=1 Tax=Paraflavitalea sp. CAU 1676 TaxID=3032598 RepID=UPI0023DCA04E|nr:C25 family cysteine peptidase [Paraflavitalea sp. CAU 1676]MDF2189771.1 C25 family cysteine peptidase [Paraflavitalea sp. CAU 1676]